MDTRFETVLARYHARIAQEDRLIKQAPTNLMKRRDEFLLAVGPEVGWLLHALIIGRGARRILELGTSYGYSTLFLADAARRTGGRVYSMDLAADKQQHARKQLEDAGLEGYVEWMPGDAIQLLRTMDGPFDAVLLDLWKDKYVACFDLFHGKLAENAVIVADNMLFPEVVRPDAAAYRAAVKSKRNLQSVLLPMGNGIELSCVWNQEPAAGFPGLAHESARR
jgi:predicted O-methyltransferase YrrM